MGASEVLSGEQFGLIPTADLGFNYHPFKEPEAREYDSARPDESTRIRQPVDIYALHTTQYGINVDRARQKLEGHQPPPKILKVHGQDWVEDGHHRITAAMARGDTRIMADVALTDRASSSSHYEMTRR